MPPKKSPKAGGQKKKTKKSSVSTPVRALVATSTKERSAGAVMYTTNRGSGSIRVQKREFVGTVTNASVTDFSLDANSLASPGWDFNPGVSSLFPWLSTIALAYERYRFKSLSFELVSSQATSTAGRVYVAVDYDYDDEVPATKAKLMGNMTAMEAPIWSNLKMVCDPRQLMRDQPFKFVSVGGRISPEPRTCYSGFLIIGFDTPTANCKFDLFVTYDVELEVPTVDEIGAVLSCSTPQAPSLPLVNTENPWYTAAIAGGFKLVQARWLTNSFDGPIRRVVGELGDVPRFIRGVTSGMFFQRGLDLGHLGNALNVTLEGALRHATTTPTTWATHALMGADVFSAAGGTQLGYLDGNSKSSMLDYGSRYNAGEQSTNDKFEFPYLSFNMASLRALYPTARYIVPLIAVADALGLGAVEAYTGINYRVW